MRQKLLAAVAMGFVVLMLAGTTFAHHGGAAYDMSRMLILKGTVSDFQFIQPHPLIALDVKDDQGNVTKWSVEMTAPNHLVHYGWNGHKLKPGDEIVVSGNAAKNGLKVLNLRKISWANGEEIPLGPPPEPNTGY